MHRSVQCQSVLFSFCSSDLHTKCHLTLSCLDHFYCRIKKWLCLIVRWLLPRNAIISLSGILFILKIVNTVCFMFEHDMMIQNHNAICRDKRKSLNIWRSLSVAVILSRSVKFIAFEAFHIRYLTIHGRALQLSTFLAELLWRLQISCAIKTTSTTKWWRFSTKWIARSTLPKEKKMHKKIRPKWNSEMKDVQRFCVSGVNDSWIQIQIIFLLCNCESLKIWCTI